MNNRFIQSSGIMPARSRKLSYSYVPTIKELQFHLGELCQTNIGGRLDICFYENSEPYVLVLEYKKLVGAANWKFYRIAPSSFNLIWEHVNSDVALIQNLILNTLNEQSNHEKTILNTLSPALPSPQTQKSDSVEMELLANLKQFLSEVQHEQPVVQIKPPKPKEGDLIDLNIGKQALEETLINELGILSYPAFLFCLIREYAATQEDKTALSVLLIKLTVNENKRDDGLPMPVLVNLLDKIKKLQRKTDIIAQYDIPNTFAVILPETDIVGGKYFAGRVEALISNLTAASTSVKFTAAVASAGGFCNSIETILGAAELTLKKVENSEQSIGTFSELILKGSPTAKNIDMELVQGLVERLIARPYAIFSFPILVAFIEHEYNRAKRNKRTPYFLLITLTNPEQNNEDIGVLEETMSLLVQRMTLLQENNFLLAQYGINSIAVLSSKASMINLRGYGKQVADSIADKPLSVNDAIKAYKLESKLCKVEMEDNHRQMVRISPA